MSLRFFAILSGLVLLTLLGRAGDDLGYLQIRGPAGVAIKLNGTATVHRLPATEDGLLLRDLRAGDLLAQAWQREHLLREAKLVIQPGRVTLWDLSDLGPLVVVTPLPGPAPKERQRLGSLLLHTVPVACDIDIPDMGVDGLRKDQEMLRFDEVPVGQYQIIARAMGKTLSVRATIAEGRQSEWLFDFSNDDVFESTPMRNTLGQSYRYLRGGDYTMGSRQGRVWEQPQPVRLSDGFWLADREVTIGEFRTLMAEELPQVLRLMGDSPAQHPVQVTWAEAVLFASRLSAQPGAGGHYRLPTEAEWEYACRAGTTGDFAGDLGELAWYELTSVTGWRQMGLDPSPRRELRPVATKAANPWGLYDMHGSLAEWCLDQVTVRTAKDGTYTISPVGDGTSTLGNPLGIHGEHRPFRGGDYRASAASCRSWTRSAAAPDARVAGFRLVFVPAYAMP